MVSLKKYFIIIFLFILSVSSYSNEQNKELIFYIGITMVKPVSVLAKEFEINHNCKIKILQGGSQDLYDSAIHSKIGDIYMPGSISYRNKHIKEGFLEDVTFVGYNRIALVVKKGNPLNVKPTLDELTNPNLRVVLGNAESGSIGNATKKVLTKYGIYEKAMLNSLYLESDSRNLTSTIKMNHADLILNWYATTFWDDNKTYLEALEIDEEFSNKAMITLNLLKFSKNKELAKKFMKYATSQRGKEVFYEYGFLTKKEFENFDTVKIK